MKTALYNMHIVRPPGGLGHQPVGARRDGRRSGGRQPGTNWTPRIPEELVRTQTGHLCGKYKIPRG